MDIETVIGTDNGYNSHFKEIPIDQDKIKCFCQLKKNAKESRPEELTEEGKKLYYNGEIILLNSSDTQEGKGLAAAILNKNTGKIAIKTSVYSTNKTLKKEGKPTIEEGYRVYFTASQQPAFFWRRLKNILQDTYGETE